MNNYRMKGKVYNIRSAYPPDAVNIMRGSIFGNPYYIGRDGNRQQVLSLYEEYLIERINTDTVFREAVKQLHGKSVLCCCHPLPCHGDILLRVANNLWKRDDYT